MNGIIVIDKPAGWTSHDVIGKLRGLFRERRIGHGGTLDPMATGVLPVFVGRATRAVPFCENAEKEYIGTLRPGVMTDTQDITGTVLETRACSVTADDVLSVIPRFLGEQRQLPPGGQSHPRHRRHQSQRHPPFPSSAHKKTPPYPIVCGKRGKMRHSAMGIRH